MTDQDPWNDTTTTAAKGDLESNYGSELGPEDEAALSALLSQTESQYGDIRDLASVRRNGAYPLLDGSRVATFDGASEELVDETGVTFTILAFERPSREASVEVEYDPQNRIAFSPRSASADAVLVSPSGDSQTPLEVVPEPEEPDPFDTRSPLERFKSKRPLSVTNIVSPAWCEMQYWYNLTRYGRVRRTKAMKQGSSVHKVMEEQSTTQLPVEGVKSLVKKVLQEELKTAVTEETLSTVVRKVLDKEKRPAVPIDVAAGLIHKVLKKENIAPVSIGIVSEALHKALGEKMRIAVPVEVATKEDAFGLRIWNVIHALRTLRATGLAREIEVWAEVEGEVVNGIIDELSFQCPDDELEARLMEKKERTTAGKRKRTFSVPTNQATLQSLWQNTTAGSDEGGSWLGTLHQARTVYLADIKTRGSVSVPTGDAALRPTVMQLMMYHRMLSLLAANCVPAQKIFERYKLDNAAHFSDSFMAQMSSLDTLSAEERISDFEIEQDAIDEILGHNTLEKLWTLMTSEMARTMPFSKDKSVSPIGDVLRVEYRASRTGTVIGTKTFAYDGPILDAYLQQIMAWWKGQRMPKGVDIEEAFKCRSCEFVERCSWRKDKADQHLKVASKNRLRRQERSSSQV
ncbi:hypothetical protein AAFC00_001025 [Neodothiora populina]|uniref:Exonuclease V n=1 Tax=Neodothiora populina TaxID=2781224 RepID=A0ABR3PMU2_9PEZI